MSAYERVRRMYPLARSITVKFHESSDEFIVDCPTLMGGRHRYIHQHGEDVVVSQGGGKYGVNDPQITLGEALRG